MSTGVPAVESVLVCGGAVSLLLGASTAMCRVNWAALHVPRHITQFLDDWYGEADRSDVHRPGVLQFAERSGQSRAATCRSEASATMGVTCPSAREVIS
ncbi:hypothetical protein [Streptomyces sp. NPDC059466]|uniref:hypothetical protein n=1 Tax=unclassified Streptomyces TaxID=2593676 RepID=UPI003697B2FF